MPKSQEQQPITVQDRTAVLESAKIIFSQFREQQRTRHATEQKEYSDAENIHLVIGQRKNALISLLDLMDYLRDEGYRVIPDLAYYFIKAQEKGTTSPTGINKVIEFMNMLNRVSMYRQTFDCLFHEYLKCDELIGNLSFDEFRAFEIQQP